MATLRILFSGLCAFLPRSSGETPPVDVLLVNTSNKRTQLLAKQPEPHDPVLRFNFENLPGGSMPGGDPLWVGSAQGMWDLDSEQITFDVSPGTTAPAPVKQGVTLTKGPQPANLAAPQDPVQAASFDWVPKISDALPDEGEVDPVCLLPNPGDEAPIIARIRLWGGKLSTAGVGSFLDQPIISQFAPPSPKSRSQSLAHRVAFEMDLADGARVTFRATKFSPPNAQRFITLVPNGKGLIEVQITNLCCGERLDPIRSRLRPKTEVPFVDDDFECFYILCKGFDAPPLHQGLTGPFGAKYTRLPIPHFVQYPLGRPDSGQGGGIDTVRCNLAQLKATPTP